MTNAIVPAGKRTDLETSKELTPMQEAFAVAYATGELTAEQAAIEAGYSETSARVLGPRQLRNQLVQQRIWELTRETFVTTAPQAAATMRRLLNARSEFVQMQASQDLLNRAFGKPVEKVTHSVSGELQVSIDLG